MTIPTTDTVLATLTYFQPPPDGAKPYLCINQDPVTGKHDCNWAQEPHEGVLVENLRGKEGSVTLDVQGFQFGRAQQGYTAFKNDKEIEEKYYPESIELVKRITGASRIVPFDHTIRRRRPGEIDDGPQKRQPVPQVHVDQTKESSTARVFRHVADDASELVKHRFQIINLWRPIHYTAWDWPLALCDYRSIDVEGDLVPTTLKYPDHDGETLSIKYNPGHRWKYLKGMDPDEFVLIKCFDSRNDGKTAILTPHTAFDDTTKPSDAPLRESIELRLLVFYEDQ